MIEYEYNFIFDSGGSSVINKSTDGSQFDIILQQELNIPLSAKYAYITVYDATVWNNVYNVNEGVNDTFYVEYDDGFTTVNEEIVIIPGLYDVDHLNSALLRELNNNPALPSDLFQIVPDTASSRAVIQFNYSGTQIDFTQADTLREILGFSAALVPLAPTTGIDYVIGDTTAAFNNLNYFTIGSDLVQQGIRINDTYYQTLCKVPITDAPGSQINYQPQNPPKISCNELIGAKRKNISVWLTDNFLNRVNTNNESFSISLNIHYAMME